VDGRPNPRNKAASSNFSSVVWAEPKTEYLIVKAELDMPVLN